MIEARTIRDDQTMAPLLMVIASLVLAVACTPKPIHIARCDPPAATVPEGAADTAVEAHPSDTLAVPTPEELAAALVEGVEAFEVDGVRVILKRVEGATEVESGVFLVGPMRQQDSPNAAKSSQ